jgi:hypothetical protein
MSSMFVVRSDHFGADASQDRSISSGLDQAMIRSLRRARVPRGAVGASVVELGLLVVAIGAVVTVLVLALTSVIRSNCDSGKNGSSGTSQSC